MGYFGHLYLVEVTDRDDAVEVATSVLGAYIAPKAYFCWGAGDRPAGLHDYAEGTVFSDQTLRLLPGYPLIDKYDGDCDRVLLEATFTPSHPDDPSLFHFSLPSRSVPRPDYEPLIQPVEPFICAHQSGITITYPVIGGAQIRFWIARLPPDDSLANYDIAQMLQPSVKRKTKVELEFNLGIFKVEFACGSRATQRKVFEHSQKDIVRMCTRAPAWCGVRSKR